MCAETPIDDIFINDWAATCAIYDISEENTVQKRQSSVVWVSFDLSMSLGQGLAFIRRMKEDGTEMDFDPRFGISTLTSQDELPVFQVTFQYDVNVDNMEERLISVEINFSKYPTLIWPEEAKDPWLEWMNKQASDILSETEMSYTVCEWIEHNALEFYGIVINDLGSGFNAAVSLEYTFEGGNGSIHIEDRLRYPTALFDENDDSKKKTVTLESFARSTILSKWREWLNIQCLFCFEEIVASDAIEITCGHMYCRECITRYIQTTVPDLPTHHENPFKCPVLSCRNKIQLNTCVKDLASKEEWKALVQWRHNIKHPKALMLQVCPKKSCGARNMRQSKQDHVVFCDDCGGTWCELCMQRFVGDHDKEDCDAVPVFKLCRRYRNASDEIKEKADKRWPWLKEYAVARSEDMEMAAWISDNGQPCPNCGMGIIRSEGCFHMSCTNCSTHFCYECGEELFYPFYGTHHCWEAAEQNQFLFD
jgi:hypothetical protein